MAALSNNATSYLTEKSGDAYAPNIPGFSTSPVWWDIINHTYLAMLRLDTCTHQSSDVEFNAALTRVIDAGNSMCD